MVTETRYALTPDNIGIGVRCTQPQLTVIESDTKYGYDRHTWFAKDYVRYSSDKNKLLIGYNNHSVVEFGVDNIIRVNECNIENIKEEIRKRKKRIHDKANRKDFKIIDSCCVCINTETNITFLMFIMPHLSCKIPVELFIAGVHSYSLLYDYEDITPSQWIGHNQTYNNSQVPSEIKDICDFALQVMTLYDMTKGKLKVFE